MSLQDFLDDDTSRFATVALVDTNGLLRGQMVSTRSLKGILKAGMGMAPAQLALDPTDEMLEMPGVTDGSGDFHDDPLIVDPSSARRIPWAKPGHDLLLLTNYSGETAAICPRSILRSVLERVGAAGYVPKYGMELEYTLFDETAETAREKGYRNLKTATMHPSHDLVLYQTVQTEWYEAIAAMCEPLKIDLAKMHEEIGGGFMEACIAAGEGLEPADQLVLLKNFLRALAMRQGRCVTFMPRWTETADSQSIHVHVSLKDTAGNGLFFEDGARNAVLIDAGGFGQRPASARPAVVDQHIVQIEQQQFRRHQPAAISLNTACAAARVCAISASPCMADRKPASNADGAKYTPRSSMPWKKRLKRSLSVASTAV